MSSIVGEAAGRPLEPGGQGAKIRRALPTLHDGGAEMRDGKRALLLHDAQHEYQFVEVE